MLRGRSSGMNPSSNGVSNLRSFLRCTTPMLSSSLLHQTNLHCSDILDGNDHDDYIILNELWSSYQEWSSYGVGVPIRCGNGEVVTQYYAPYLSAIQIFTRSPRNTYSTMGIDSNKNGSWRKESENEKPVRSWETMTNGCGDEYEGSQNSRSGINHLYFQYFETSSPYGRLPLLNTVDELSQENPGITTLKNVDLSPASWMSIYWSPIYTIPTRVSIKELSACFLTYHALSSYSLVNVVRHVQRGICSNASRMRGTYSWEASLAVAFQPFGLATYKLQGPLWINPEAGDQETIGTLLNGAKNWLSQHEVQHHDFDYFTNMIGPVSGW